MLEASYYNRGCGTNRCAHFRGRFRHQNFDFGTPGTHFDIPGSILVIWGGPRDLKADPIRKNQVFSSYFPSAQNKQIAVKGRLIQTYKKHIRFGCALASEMTPK